MLWLSSDPNGDPTWTIERFTSCSLWRCAATHLAPLISVPSWHKAMPVACPLPRGAPRASSNQACIWHDWQGEQKQRILIGRWKVSKWHTGRGGNVIVSKMIACREWQKITYTHSSAVWQVSPWLNYMTVWHLDEVCNPFPTSSPLWQSMKKTQWRTLQQDWFRFPGQLTELASGCNISNLFYQDTHNTRRQNSSKTYYRESEYLHTILNKQQLSHVSDLSDITTNASRLKTHSLEEG